MYIFSYNNKVLLPNINKILTMLFAETIIYYVFPVLVFIFLVSVPCLLIYARWNYGTLEKCGIPVVKPHFFLGSNPNIHNEKPHLVDLERSNNYGKVYGVYHGREPIVFISDPKLLKIIQTRDFEYFRNHRKILPDEHFIWSQALDFYDDEKWKLVRSLFGQHFTVARIKKMSSKVNEIAHDYVNALKSDQSDQEKIAIDMRVFGAPLALEIFSTCLAGVEIENARDPNNQLVQTLNKAFESLGGESSFTWWTTLTYTFPFLCKLSKCFPIEHLENFASTIRNVMRERKILNIVADDFMSTMIKMIEDSKTDPEYIKFKITEESGISQVFSGIFAGHDSICTTLSVLSYYLASNSHIQDRLLDEIDGIDNVSWDACSNVPYLNACITESLRIVPAFFRVDRVCTMDWEYNGIRIPKGMSVVVPLWALHRDPDIYPEPETFEPERFMPGKADKIDSYAFGTFGNGPRSCMARRMTFEFLKIILINFLKVFRFEKHTDTKLRERLGSPFLSLTIRLL